MAKRSLPPGLLWTDSVPATPFLRALAQNRDEGPDHDRSLSDEETIKEALAMGANEAFLVMGGELDGMESAPAAALLAGAR